MVEPTFPVEVRSFNGDYCAFYDYTENRMGLMDYRGNILFTSAKTSSMLEPLPNGCAAEMIPGGWAILNGTTRAMAATILMRFAKTEK